MFIDEYRLTLFCKSVNEHTFIIIKIYSGLSTFHGTIFQYNEHFATQHQLSCHFLYIFNLHLVLSALYQSTAIPTG